jgi:hypothetical protein
VVKQTFSPGSPIQSGRLAVNFGLSASRRRGSQTHRESFQLHMKGPFQSLGAGRAPRFALTVALRSSAVPRTLHATVTSTGAQLFIGLDGRQFLAPPASARALQQGYARASGGSASTGGSPLAALGLDPAAWLVNPRIAGSRTLGGVQTTHVVAGLNVSRFLADASALSSAAAPIGLGAARQGPGVAASALAGAPPGAFRVKRVDLFSGAKDHLLRRLALRLTLVATPQSRAALGDLRRATLTLVLGLSALNQPQKIAAPRHARPFSELAPLLAGHS